MGILRRFERERHRTTVAEPALSDGAAQVLVIGRALCGGGRGWRRRAGFTGRLRHGAGARALCFRLSLPR